MKILSLVKQYIASSRLAYETELHYHFVARLFVRDTKIVYVEDVTQKSLLHWSKEVKKRNVEPISWNNYVRHFRILIAFAVCQGYLKDNPITGDIFERVYRQRPKTLRIAELHQIIAYLGSKKSIFKPTWFWKALVRVLFYTGMRRKQLVHLRWKDIDFDDRKITFDAHSSKTKVSWEIPLTTAAISELTKIQNETLSVIGPDKDLSERYVFNIRLFNTRYRCKDRMVEWTVTNFFNRLSTVTGIQVSAHRLRHTVATQLAKEGKYKELQNLLGHSTMQTTMRYIHPELENIRDLMTMLDQYNV